MVTHRNKKASGKKPAIAFSKSYDNGEILRPRITRSMQYVVRSFSADIPFEEYVVPAAPVSVQAPVTEPKPAAAPVVGGDQVAGNTLVSPADAPVAQPVQATPPTPDKSGDAAKLDVLDKIKRDNPLAQPARPAEAAKPAQAAAAATPSKSASMGKAPDFERFNSAASAKSNDEEDDFVKDMQAIMRGEKLYNQDAKTIESRSNKPPEPAMPNTLSQMENKQAIFDQIAESMTYAKAYDLGNIDLDKRFSDFDKAAEKREEFYRSASMSNKPAPPATPSDYGNYPSTPPSSNRFAGKVGSVNAVTSEDFLTDLNSIARIKEERARHAGVTRKKEYLYEESGMTLSKASGYSYMQTPALIAGIAVSDAIQIGLGAVSVAQAGVSSVAGSFSLTYDKVQRLLTTEARSQMPGAQSAKLIYHEELLWIGELKEGFADATIVIDWEGNAYGEIGTAVISRDLDKSTDWTKSSCNINFTRLERIPQPGLDPRVWPIVYRYDGEFNPVGNGKYEFEGEFEINAFGGLTHTRHHVVDRSFIEFMKMGEPEDYVRKRPDVIKKVPDIPAEQLNYLKTKLP